MKVLVTGASGFLGSHVAEQLKARGDEVRCLVRKSSATKHLKDLGVDLVYGAVDDADTLPDALRGVDAVVHCAGVIKAKSQADFDRVNEAGTRAMLEATLAVAPKVQRFVHVSTAGVMGPGTPERVHTRDADPNPTTQYSKSKLRGEQVAKEFAKKLPITIIRPPAIYGPRDGEMLALFKMVSYGLAIRLGDYKSMSMVFGPDAARACVRAIERDVPSGAVYFVTDGTAYSFDQLVDHMQRALGVETWARPSLPRFVLDLAANVSERYGKAMDKAVIFNRDKLNELSIEHFRLDIEPTISELGWRPEVPFDEGAKKTVAWYRQNGWM
jgi:nucleoside-diphosphate-sugar epimerase